MKKLTICLLLFAALLAFPGCGQQQETRIEITVPAGCTEDFVYAEEQICPVKTFDFYGGEGIHVKTEFQVPEDRGIILTSQDPRLQVYASNTTDELVLLRKTWYRIGVMGENRSNEDLKVTLIFENVQAKTTDSPD